MKSQAPQSHAHDHLAKCEREHGAAVTALTNADAALVRATETYDTALGQGRDIALAARHAQSDAEVDRDIARHALDTAALRLEEARVAASEAETERLTEVARTRIREFEVAATRDLKSMAQTARRLARLYAEAEIARDNAVRGGAKEASLPSVEEFRSVPGFPREVIETRRDTRWIHPFTIEPLNDEQMARVFGHAAGEAFLQGSAGPLRLSDKAVCDRTVVLPAQRARSVAGFLETLSVPGLMADEVAGWTPPENLSPNVVLAHLDRLEGAPSARPERSPRATGRIAPRAVERAGVRRSLASGSTWDNDHPQRSNALPFQHFGSPRVAALFHRQG